MTQPTPMDLAQLDAWTEALIAKIAKAQIRRERWQLPFDEMNALLDELAELRAARHAFEEKP